MHFLSCKHTNQSYAIFSSHSCSSKSWTIEGRAVCNAFKRWKKFTEVGARGDSRWGEPHNSFKIRKSESRYEERLEGSRRRNLPASWWLQVQRRKGCSKTSGKQE